MSFGKNLQFLRKTHNNMTQETLAEKMSVSRQTVSKWELDMAYPEIPKIFELCRLFSCTIDHLFNADLKICSEAYSNFRTELLEEFKYIEHTVISTDPENDAMQHIRAFAAENNVLHPDIIGWDFPFVSQEQLNVFHMHGYTAAWILPSGITLKDTSAEIITQEKLKYAVLTIDDPFSAPFSIIPNAYKALTSYIEANGLEHKSGKNIISCFEKQYKIDQNDRMDIYIAIK